MAASPPASLVFSLSVTYPPHATKTIEQTVIGQFEFMYTRRSHERFVGPSRLGLPQNTCTFASTCVYPVPAPVTTPLVRSPHPHTPARVSVFSICVFILCLCCSVLFCSVGLWSLHGQPCQMLRVMARKCCCRKRIRNLILSPPPSSSSPLPLLDNSSESWN